MIRQSIHRRAVVQHAQHYRKLSSLPYCYPSHRNLKEQSAAETAVATSSLRSLQLSREYKDRIPWREDPSSSRFLSVASTPSPRESADDSLSSEASSSSSSSSSIHDFLAELQRAAAWNHGKDPESGRQYRPRHDKSQWDPAFCRLVTEQYDAYLQEFVAGLQSQPQEDLLLKQRELLLSAETVNLAFKALLKCHYPPQELSTKVRDWERSLGRLQQTPLTDHLSLRLLTANGKAGNVGRVLSLLQLRQARAYRPRKREFVYAITALQAAAAQAIPLTTTLDDGSSSSNTKSSSSAPNTTNNQRSNARNIFVSDAQQAAIDNPTRWLDAILMNMHQRGFALTTYLANHMLHCYAAGYTGKAVHHLYVSATETTVLLVETPHVLTVCLSTCSLTLQLSCDATTGHNFAARRTASRHF